jgi:hypothetical protein
VQVTHALLPGRVELMPIAPSFAGTTIDRGRSFNPDLTKR